MAGGTGFRFSGLGVLLHVSETMEALYRTQMGTIER